MCVETKRPASRFLAYPDHRGTDGPPSVERMFDPGTEDWLWQPNVKIIYNIRSGLRHLFLNYLTQFAIVKRHG
jgi:hypothetical protein